MSSTVYEICDRLHLQPGTHGYLYVRLHLEFKTRWYKYGCLTTSWVRNSLNLMLAWIVSRSTVLSNNRSLPTAQLSLPSAHYALHLVHKTSSCLLVIKTTLPRVAFACWVLFIAFPAGLISTILIFIRSLLLHAYCSLAFGTFKPASYCSFSVLRCP